MSIFALTCFSFYYTDKIVDFSKSKDPIMIELKDESLKYAIEPVDALVFDDYIIPGLSGRVVDVNSSYSKMKKLGSYNSNLLVFVKELPEVSIKSYQDKFIIQGNKSKKEVYLVFQFADQKYLEEIVSIVNNNDVKANFFIDGYLLESKEEELTSYFDNDNYFIGNLGYKNKYEATTLRYTNGLIERNFNNSLFCLTTSGDKSVLDLCSKNKMYTLKPTLIDSSYPYNAVKEKLESGSIFTFNANSYLVRELDAIIKLIKQKGYEISLVSSLLLE